jgi:hypothetical protein
LPQGSTLDQTDIDAVTAIARERGMTNEQAQNVLNEMSTSFASQSAAFRTELESHAEIGGANLEAAQADMHRALDHFLPKDSPEGKALRSVMTRTGYGNYAPLALAFARIGRAMKEDRPLSQSPSGGTVLPTEDVLFKSSSGFKS